MIAGACVIGMYCFSTIPVPWQYYTDSVHSELVGNACKFGCSKSVLRASSVLPVQGPEWMHVLLIATFILKPKIHGVFLVN